MGLLAFEIITVWTESWHLRCFLVRMKAGVIFKVSYYMHVSSHLELGNLGYNIYSIILGLAEYRSLEPMDFPDPHCD